MDDKFLDSLSKIIKQNKTGFLLVKLTTAEGRLFFSYTTGISHGKDQRFQAGRTALARRKL